MTRNPGPADVTSFGRFFLPGPTEVHPDVLQAQARPVIGHRGAAIQSLMQEVVAGLQEVFVTDRPVFVSTSSATGLMEAAVRNGARTRVLSLVNGAFSARFAAIARSCGLEVDELAVPWGHAHDASEVEARLRERRYDAVTVVHSETSTGALNRLEDLSWVVAEHEDTLLLVDSVTGVGGAEVRTDEWRLDFVLTGSQKALALPPGLAFGVASDAMMARSSRLPGRGTYFDLAAFGSNLRRFQTPNTPAVTLLYALQEQLRRIRSEGMGARWSRHRRMAARTWTWVEEMREERGVPVRMLAPEGNRSPTVSCIRLPGNWTGPRVVAALEDRGFVIGAGYGKLKDETIRIGHMGDHTLEELEALLHALEEVLDA